MNDFKKFDLEKALKGESVITGDNREALEIHFFRSENCNVCVCAVIEGDTYHFDKNGMPWLNPFATLSDNESLKLYMAPKKRKGWINICPPSMNLGLDDKPGLQNNIFNTREEAISESLFKNMTQVEIEWEE